MAIFIMLSKFSLRSPGEIKSLSVIDQELDQRLFKECPRVKRIASYALLGEFDFLNIFDAPDASTATKVALIIQSLGMGKTQTLTGIPFKEFRDLVEEI